MHHVKELTLVWIFRPPAVKKESTQTWAYQKFCFISLHWGGTHMNQALE